MTARPQKPIFALIDFLKLNFVGSVKHDQHKDLVQVANNDPIFEACPAEGGIELEGTKAFRVKKEVYGKERVIVVTYNQNLFNAQWLTLQNDISKAIKKTVVTTTKTGRSC